MAFHGATNRAVNTLSVQDTLSLYSPMCFFKYVKELFIFINKNHLNLCLFDVEKKRIILLQIIGV